MTNSLESFVRIRVNYVNGAWETEDGRRVTASNGTAADLILAQDDVTRLWPKRVIPTRERAQFLEPGAKIRISLRVKQPKKLAGERMRHLIPPGNMFRQIEWGKVQGWHSNEAHFFEIVLGDPTQDQKDEFPNFSGGLLVGVRGMDVGEVSPSTFNLPKDLSATKPRTLNHAYTILSEIYEFHRASHTGSIFQNVFYQSEDNRWYPLGLLKAFGIAAAQGVPPPSEPLAKAFWASAPRWAEK